MNKYSGDIHREGQVPEAESGAELAELRAALVKRLGENKGNWAAGRVSDAATAFDEDRHLDALDLLKPVMRTEACELAEIRELYGLVHYRLGHWKAAVRELKTFEAQMKTLEQHPVLADCYRAMQHWRKVDDLWEEMCSAALPCFVLTEGRIVAAGALADQGRLEEATALLNAGWELPTRPKEHHLRRAYALADCYDQAGNLVAARRLFAWIDENYPGFVDAAQRAHAIGG